jgi:hypothetical protein
LLDGEFVTISKEVEDVVLAGGSFFPPGYVYSGGYSSVGDSASRLVRRTDTGSEDPVLSFTTNIGPVLSVAPALDGTDTLYAGGGFANRIVRLFSIGTTDLGFNVVTGFNGDVRKILRADDAIGDDPADIYVVGGFTTYEGDSAKGIERLNADGSPDETFLTGTGFTIPDGTAPFDDIASVALALNPAGTIYVGGDFLLYNDTARNGIARLNPDGSLDLGFAVEISSAEGNCTNETIPGLD